MVKAPVEKDLQSFKIKIKEIVNALENLVIVLKGAVYFIFSVEIF